jgi:hypothetical protein
LSKSLQNFTRSRCVGDCLPCIYSFALNRMAVAKAAHARHLGDDRSQAQNSLPHSAQKPAAGAVCWWQAILAGCMLCA